MRRPSGSGPGLAELEFKELGWLSSHLIRQEANLLLALMTAFRWD